MDCSPQHYLSFRWIEDTFPFFSTLKLICQYKLKMTRRRRSSYSFILMSIILKWQSKNSSLMIKRGLYDFVFFEFWIIQKQNFLWISKIVMEKKNGIFSFNKNSNFWNGFRQSWYLAIQYFSVFWVGSRERVRGRHFVRYVINERFHILLINLFAFLLTVSCLLDFYR